MENKYKVIITAYNTSQYIEECLDSISKQKFKDFDIILGIDNCDKTLEKVLEIKDKYNNLKIINFQENNGYTVCFNTISSLLDDDDILIRFDSDDVMINTYVETIVKYFSRFKNYDREIFVNALGKNFKNENGFTKYLNSEMMHGLFSIKNKLFKKIGGLPDWRTSADTDLYYRIKHLHKEVRIIECNKDIMLRRIHDTSLTNSLDYGWESDYRKSIRQLKEFKKYRVEEYKTTDKYIIL